MRKPETWLILTMLSVGTLFGCSDDNSKAVESATEGGDTDTASTTFQNPIITGMNPDPSIVRVDDDYYLITSTFEYFPGLPVYQSKDLVHWKLIGHALSTPTNNPLMGCDASYGGQYAATIRYHDGTFYVIGTNYGGAGSQGVFYVTATDPAGPWSDPNWLGQWYVDPSLMFEDDMVYYLSPDNEGAFLAAELNTESGRFRTNLETIAEGLGGSSPEGPHMYKRGDDYYLMSAEGGTGYEHREVVQRSTSPFGPFEASPHNPLISHEDHPDHPFQAIGHADLVETPDGWWLVCLGIRPVGGRYHHLGRETFLAPVTWDEDGWPHVGTEGIVEEALPLPDLPQHVWEAEPTRDDFDSDTLRLVWNFVRNPHDADWSLTEKAGALRLNGSAVNFEEKDSPAFVCRRQTDFNIVASTKVSFEPTASNEEAGLVVRGNDINYYSFTMTLVDDQRIIRLRKVLDGDVDDTVDEAIADGDITLRISATENEYQFWIQEDGEAAVSVGTAPTQSLSTEVIEGFTGVFIGMYASGNGAANTNPADFDWFELEEGVLPPYEWESE